MKQLSKLFLAGIFVAAGATMSYAQYKGPGAEVKILTIKEVTQQASKLDRNDTMVKLRGFIIQQINGDTFWFQDKTGKIRVEIEKESLPAVPFDDKTELVIAGEVDYNWLEGTEIEVKHIEMKNL